MKTISAMDPITLKTHHLLGWRPQRSYDFAQSLTLQPVGVMEIAKVSQSMPVAFAKNGRNWGAIAVLGPPDGSNLYVDNGGRWLGGYIPSGLRFYPFKYNEMQLHLWPNFVAESVAEKGVEPFFKGNSLTAAVQSVAIALGGLSKTDAEAQPVFELLMKVGALVPWALPAPRDVGAVATYPSLFQLDRARFDDLSDENWLSLRRYKSHSWLYAHLESLSLASRFPAMAARKSAAKDAPPSPTVVAQTKPSQEVSYFLSALSQDLEASR